jgi:hypothetical protein
MKKIGFVILLLCAFIKVEAQRKLEQIDPEKEEQIKQQKQDEDKRKAAGPKWYDKVNFGGSASMFFSNVGSQFSVQPIALYNFNDYVSSGVGLSYFYYSLNYATSTGTQTYSNNAYGANVFGRFKLFDGIFAQAEYMPMNVSVYYPSTRQNEREWVDAFLVGAGQLQPFGDRSGGYFVVLYDLLYDAQRSFSPSPLHIRVGMYF